MTVTCWTGATRWWCGVGALEAALAQGRPAAGSRTLLLLDAQMAATPAGSRLVARAREALGVDEGGPLIEELHRSGETTTERVEARARLWRDQAIERIVAMGGGSTLDLAVLAALEPGTVASRPATRSGLVVLPPSCRPAIETLLVPTTLGTGAEVSSSACVERSDGKVLVLGAALRPGEAVVDAAATDGLPDEMCAEAAVEVLARLLVPLSRPRPSSTDRASDPLGLVADEHARADLRALATVMSSLPQTGTPRHLRLQLAAVSASSHAGWDHLARDPFASPVWFVATELASVLRVNKVVATALLLPGWARAVLDGDGRWSDAGLLERAWRTVREACAHSLSADPASGLAALTRRLVPAAAALSVGDPAATAYVVGERVARRWGAGLPMLGVLDADAVTHLVEAALRPALRTDEAPQEELCSI